jgi:amino acid adenylation domain-containing protein
MPALLLHEFYKRLNENPGATALAAGDCAWSYRELNLRSNQAANSLRERGIREGAVVALHLPRGFDFVAAALGIWKAGAAYLPVDPTYPAERVAAITEDARPAAIITPGFIARAAQCSNDAPGAEVHGNDLAYVIYTSGSTGTPKGVEITHSGLAHLVAWHRDAFQVTPADRASQVAGLGFDAAVWELWPYLASGASVHLCDEIARMSPELLRDWLIANRITISFVPTPIAEPMLFLDWPRQCILRVLLTGGDTLHHYPPSGLPFELVNNYGPTECTVVATSARVPPIDQGRTELPPIGWPIADTRVHLIDGEICLESPRLARGYRHAPELTAQKFIPNPFSTDPASRLYRTGDLGSWLADGQLAFHGRIDEQIKIRGYRIEPQEIVAVLNRQPGVRDSVVIAREDGACEKRLVAYVIADRSLSHVALRNAMRERLPEFMLPAVFVRLERFPVTPNGKIDRSALLAPSFANTLQDEIAAPRTVTEGRVAQMIAEILGFDDIGLNDNFFMLGGHSLLGAQLIARLRKEFGVQINLRGVFAAPTAAQLAREVDRLNAGDIHGENRQVSAVSPRPVRSDRR